MGNINTMCLQVWIRWEKLELSWGGTFESLEEIANEIDCWGWKRQDPKEWPGYHRYDWHHPTLCESLFIPDEVKVKLADFPYVKRWPVVYHNLNHGGIYDIANIEVLIME